MHIDDHHRVPSVQNSDGVSHVSLEIKIAKQDQTEGGEEEEKTRENRIFIRLVLLLVASTRKKTMFSSDRQLDFNPKENFFSLNGT